MTWREKVKTKVSKCIVQHLTGFNHNKCDFAALIGCLSEYSSELTSSFELKLAITFSCSVFICSFNYANVQIKLNEMKF